MTIPLWNHTLTPLTQNLRESRLRIEYYECEYEQDPYLLPESEQPQQLPNESNRDFQKRRGDWYWATIRVVKPEPGEFVEPPNDIKKVDLKAEFAQKGLQIIVKLANIHLTPEKPEYEGGTWHVEGQLVCAPHPYFRPQRTQY